MPTDQVVTLFALNDKVDSRIKYTVKNILTARQDRLLLLAGIIVAGVACLALISKGKP